MRKTVKTYTEFVATSNQLTQSGYEQTDFTKRAIVFTKKSRFGIKRTVKITPTWWKNKKENWA